LRWKLLIIASLAATIAGAGLCLGLNYLLFVSSLRPATTDWLAAATLILPLAAIIYATIFVYRHTARRRKLQAFLIALLSLLLTVALLFATAIISNRRLNYVPQPLQKTSNEGQH
jgi:uncharacterized membrane protein YoaK (UPF0700 family)